jgi:hypothetical protein
VNTQQEITLRNRDRKANGIGPYDARGLCSVLLRILKRRSIGSVNGLLRCVKNTHFNPIAAILESDGGMNSSFMRILYEANELCEDQCMETAEPFRRPARTKAGCSHSLT